MPKYPKEVKFRCPSCDFTVLEEIASNVSYALDVRVLKDGTMEYPNPIPDLLSEGIIERYQCKNCGYVLVEDVSGEFLLDEEEIVEWLEKNNEG